MPRRDSSDSDSVHSDYKRRSKKKKRQSSSSDSEDSNKRYHHKSSQSTSSSQSRSSSQERSHRKHSHSRSVSKELPRKYRVSRSSSRDHSHKRRSRSSSRSRSHKHRSRSRSTSRKHGSRHSSKSSRHRVQSRSKHKRSRSGSESDSYSRSSKKSSRKSRSRSRSPHRQKSSSQGSKMREDDVIKLKLQQALKAAATADAELREKGLLPDQTVQKAANNSTPSVADQMKRAQAIEEINSPTFTQHAFMSGISTKQEKSIDGIGDAHSAAIFGNSTTSSLTNDSTVCINNTAVTSKAMREIWKNNPEKLAHETLFEDIAMKNDKWKKKLMALRRRKLNGEHMM